MCIVGYMSETRQKDGKIVSRIEKCVKVLFTIIIMCCLSVTNRFSPITPGISYHNCYKLSPYPHRIITIKYVCSWYPGGWLSPYPHRFVTKSPQDCCHEDSRYPGVFGISACSFQVHIVR